MYSHGAGRSGCHVTGRAIFSQIGESWCANTGGGVSPGCQGQRPPAAAMLPNEPLCLLARLLPGCSSSLSRTPLCTHFQLRSMKNQGRSPRENGQGSHTATRPLNPHKNWRPDAWPEKLVPTSQSLTPCKSELALRRGNDVSDPDPREGTTVMS